MIAKAPLPRARPKAQVPDGAADIARRFGITIKALRLYEDLGLLAPHRTQNGWRTYNHADCERLHRIVSLRQLGLPLAAIGELLRTDAQGLAETLLASRGVEPRSNAGPRSRRILRGPALPCSVLSAGAAICFLRQGRSGERLSAAGAAAA
jgi:DNA-binding transcriptional MerR regulator